MKMRKVSSAERILERTFRGRLKEEVSLAAHEGCFQILKDCFRWERRRPPDQ